MTKMLYLVGMLNLTLTLFLGGCFINANCPINDDGDEYVAGWEACAASDEGAVSVWTKADSGDVLPGGDCDDQNPDVNPGADEVCNGKDDNCDGAIDEDVEDFWYLDGDHDGYGRNDDNYTYMGCSAPGWVLNDADCDDGDVTIYPSAPEACDGVDNNCNDVVDDNPPSPCP